MKITDPYSRAIEDFARSITEAQNTENLLLRRDDGLSYSIDLTQMFPSESAVYSNFEVHAMKKCKGRILDVGSGLGRHSKPLSDQGHNVTALEINKSACTILRALGIKEVICEDILKYSAKKFDTILMLNYAIGMGGDLNGISILLRHLSTLLTPKGLIIIEGQDPSLTGDPVVLRYIEENKTKGLYTYQQRQRLEYKDSVGQYFNWCYPSKKELQDIAERLHMRSSVLMESQYGSYLLTIKK